MAFDATKFNSKISVPALRTLPVVLLLDVSGSMGGDKINSLYDATVQMIDSFVDQELKEKVINVAIITFGASVDLHTKYTAVNDLKQNGIGRFTARGGTPMGIALQMAKDIIEDEDETPKKKAYTPVVVLVSDGQPNDEWRGPLDDFLNTGRTMNCQRFSVAIGDDADMNVLGQFAQSPDNVYFASDAASLADAFKTISIRSTQAATKPGPAVSSAGGNNSVSGSSTTSSGNSLGGWGLGSGDDFD